MTPLVAVLALGGIGYLLTKTKAKPPGQAQRIIVPATPSPVGPVGPVGPRQLSTLALVPGRFYRAVVTVKAPLSWLATEGKVRDHAVKQGFTGVSVSSKAPPGWPGGIRGDYYVSGTYGGAPKVFERSHGGGQVQIVDGWEG